MNCPFEVDIGAGEQVILGHPNAREPKVGAVHEPTRRGRGEARRRYFDSSVDPRSVANCHLGRLCVPRGRGHRVISTHGQLDTVSTDRVRQRRVQLGISRTVMCSHLCDPLPRQECNH